MSQTTSAEQRHMSRVQEAFFKFLMWRERHVKERTFILFVAFLVGIFGGLAALLLKLLIHFISSVLTSQIDVSAGNYVYIIFPAIGVIISALYVLSLIHISEPTRH